MSTQSCVLLVGASGRVGRMVAYHWPLLAGGTGVLTTARGTRVPAGAVNWAPLDGPRALLDHLGSSGCVPAALVMLAGVTPGPGIDPAALAGNAALADACLLAAHSAGIGRVLLASSSAVYGVDPAGRAFAEGDEPLAESAYGRAKLEMEGRAPRWRDRGLQVTALRLGNVAGADALLGPLTGRQATPAQALRIDAFADGLGPLRSYIGAGSLARVLCALATLPAPLPAVLNVAAPAPVRMAALARAANWPYEMTPAPETAHQNITLDCSLLESLHRFVPDDSQPAQMVAQWKASWS